MRGRLKLFFDGGCRPNPGRMEAAVVLRGTVHLYDDLGHGASGDAEWLALIRALELASALGLRGIELIGDSAQVVLQANAALAGAPPIHRDPAAFLALAREVKPARIRWIRRRQNLAGIALAARHPR